MADLIKIATRQSPLAMWQAEFIQKRLTEIHPNLTVELVPLVTKGDIWLETPLAKIGGKGLFVKELEAAMLDGRADIAVHSMKDVPMFFPDNLGLTAICKREDPRDAFISNNYNTFKELPKGAVVGTSSLRRQCQIKNARPDLEIKVLRGNVGTRLGKLDNNEYDAIVLAASGLIRLEMQNRITEYIDDTICLPAVGQGALGIESRLDDKKVLEYLKPLIDPETELCVTAERALNRRLEGGCQVPIAGYAELKDDKLNMRSLVGTEDGQTVLRANGECDANLNAASELGKNLAENLLNQGADKILAEIYHD